MDDSSVGTSSVVDDDPERERIGPQNVFFADGAEGFGKDFGVMEEIRRIRMLGTGSDPALNLPIEKSLRSRPRVLLFKDFRAGNSYQRRLAILNESTATVCLRYRGIECHDDASEILRTELSIETLDVARIKPGLQMVVEVKFSPRQSTLRGRENKASLVFVTWSFEDAKKRHSNVERREFRVTVRCLPIDQPHTDLAKTKKM